MPATTRKSLWALSGGVLLALNIAVIIFFIRWRIAATEAINRMESNSGFAPSQLLPNADLMWVTAHASLFFLLTLDAAVIVFCMMIARRKRANSNEPPVTEVTPAPVAAV